MTRYTRREPYRFFTDRSELKMGNVLFYCQPENEKFGKNLSEVDDSMLAMKIY